MIIIKLYVLYNNNPSEIKKGSMVLSFLRPDEEYSFAKLYDGIVINGRKEMNQIREQARLLYIDMVACAGATPCQGQTLRQALGSKSGSLWWYHKFSEKDSESDSTFNKILHIVTIRNVADKTGASEIIFYGDTKGVELAFIKHGMAKVKHSSKSLLRSLLKGTGARFKYLIMALADKLLLHFFAVKSDIRPDIIFEGFWDWSVNYEPGADKIKDNYFGVLPEKLKAKGYICSWLVWFMPDYGPQSITRSKRDALKSAAGKREIIFLQKFISIVDIAAAVIDFRPVIKYLRIRGKKEFRQIFVWNNIDFWPIVNEQLDYGFCNSTIPHHKLIETASHRAFLQYKPGMLVTFLELFLHSRALYQAAEQHGNSLISCAVQHASYNREKTFGVLDSVKEFNGRPDGYAVPSPNYIFAMGELGSEIFQESGFSPEQVYLTGVPRYDNISLCNKSAHKQGSFKVLMVTSLERSTEMEMINAVVAAADGLNIELYLRSHPFAPMEEMSGFSEYSKKIIITGGSLEEALNMADLIVFTYTTVAETALIRKIPVFQWIPSGFNASVFRDINLIPGYCSVEELNQGFREYIDNPDRFTPTDDVVELVLKKCFYKADGRAADRIVEIIGNLMMKMS